MISGPLQSIRVIEIGTVITAPLAGKILAEFGADVIKVERPEGDPFRVFSGDGISPHFAAFNKGKRSVTLDLQTSPDRARLHGLLADADVLIDNFRPGVLGRLGLDAAGLQERYPRLIHCSITGFGPDGPYSKRASYDAVALALSGFYSLLLDPERPELSGPTLADNITGMNAALGILAALEQRRQTHRGCRVETSMLEAALALIPFEIGAFGQTGKIPDIYARVAGSQSFAFRCADAKQFAIHLSSQDKFWSALIGAIERPDLASDPRFQTRELRVKNYRILSNVLADIFIKQARSHWLAALDAVDIPFGALNTMPEVVDDPQVRHLGMLDTSAKDAITVLRPVRVDGLRDVGIGPAPLLGADNDIFDRPADEPKVVE